MQAIILKSKIVNIQSNIIVFFGDRSVLSKVIYSDKVI